MGASPMLLLVSSTARTFSVSPVDSYLNLTPYAAFETTMLARIPLAFPFGIDASAVDKQVQWAFGPAIRKAYVQILQASALSL
jgi:hypothetical protein